MQRRKVVNCEIKRRYVTSVTKEDATHKLERRITRLKPEMIIAEGRVWWDYTDIYRKMLESSETGKLVIRNDMGNKR